MEDYNKKFREFMESLTIKQHREMFSKLARECCVPKSRISMWKCGSSKIGPLYRKEICRVVGRNIFDEE